MDPDTLDTSREAVNLVSDILALAATAISTWYLIDVATEGQLSALTARVWHRIRLFCQEVKWSDRMAEWVVYQAEEALAEGNHEHE